MTKQKVALEIQVLRSSDTRRTIEEIAALELRLSELNAQVRQAKKDGNTNVYSRLRVDAEAVKTQMRGLNKELTIQKKEFEAVKFAPGSYQALSAELSRTKREFKALSQEAREGIGGRDLQRRIQALDRQLKDIDASVGVFGRNVGNYASAFRALGPALAAVGIGVGLSELVQLGRESVKTFADFEQEIATLGAISGATGEDLAALERNARRLGEATQFTATEVAQLQTNFARVGFSSKEILAATEATVNLAIATTENVTRTSEVVAAAITGFGLSADEAGRVSDVLAEAFNTTALSLDKFAEGQKYVATVSAAANVDIEATAAAMGVLANAGLEGSQQGTVLRRVISLLSNENSKLSKFLGISVKSTEDFEEAMRRLSDAQIDNTKAQELVGIIAQSGLIALANNGEEVVRLAQSYRQAEGAAAATARVVGDTLSQDLLKAKSAMEGLQINVVSLAEGGLRNIVQGFTSLVDTLNRFVKVPVSEQLERERIELNNLIGVLTLTQEGEQRRSDLITEITAKYPEFIKNVDLEKASNDELQTALAKVNDEYQARILLQKLNEEVDKRQLKLQKAQIRQAETQFSYVDALREAKEFLNDQNIDEEEALRRLTEARKKEGSSFNGYYTQVSQAERLIINLTSAIAAQEKQVGRITKAQEALNKAEGERAQNLEIFREQFPDIAAGLDEITKLRNFTPGAGGEAPPPDDEDTFSGLETAAAKTKAAAGSIAFFRQELEKLNKELDETPVTSSRYADLVNAAEQAQLDLNEALRQRSLYTFKAEDFIGSPEDIDAAIAALEVALASSAGIERMKEQANLIDVDANVEALKKVEAQRIISLQRQLQAGLITEQEFERARVEIATQTEFAVLDARLAAYEVGSTEYLQLVQERADKELEIERANAQRIADTQQQLREQIQDVAIQSAGAIGNAIIQIEQNNLRAETDSRLAAIDEEYTARIEAAQGNAALVAQLEEQKERDIAEVEKEAARRRKEIAQKEAIIQSALAAIRTVANLGFPAAIPALIGQAIALTAQLATIDSQQFAKGGVVKGKTHTQGGEHFIVRSTGQHVELEGGEGVINRRSMASREVITATGTPAQIASQINEHNGYGKPFMPSWAKRVQLDQGRVGRMFAAGGVIPQAPQFINPNTMNVTATLQISEEQMREMAVIIAKETAKQTSNATGQSVKEAINGANRLSERQKFATAKTGIK